jgi:hypothetical protein
MLQRFRFQLANSTNRAFLDAQALMVNVADPKFDETAQDLSRRKNR